MLLDYEIGKPPKTDVKAPKKTGYLHNYCTDTFKTVNLKLLINILPKLFYIPKLCVAIPKIYQTLKKIKNYVVQLAIIIPGKQYIYLS